MVVYELQSVSNFLLACQLGEFPPLFGQNWDLSDWGQAPYLSVGQNCPIGDRPRVLGEKIETMAWLCREVGNEYRQRIMISHFIKCEIAQKLRSDMVSD